MVDIPPTVKGKFIQNIKKYKNDLKKLSLNEKWKEYFFELFLCP